MARCNCPGHCERCGNGPCDCMCPPMVEETTSLHVVPKADVDKLFRDLVRNIKFGRAYVSPQLLARLRGTAYNGTFLTTHTILREKA